MAFARCDFSYYYYYQDSSGLIPYIVDHSEEGTFTSSLIKSTYVGGDIKLFTPAEIKAKEKLPDIQLGRGDYVQFPLYGSANLDSLKNSYGDTITGENYTYSISEGTYFLTYSYNYSNVNGAFITRQGITLTYTFSVIENRYPLKKWTIMDVINRVFDTIEPLRYGQKPRFRLQGVIYDDETGNAIGYKEGSIAEKLDKILSPEFAFTKMNLREMLQQIGGYIHGEPRIVDTIIENDGIYFIVSFDKLGGDKKAYIKGNYITATFGTDINEYCTSLDSSVDNIVNQLSFAQGVTVSPFYGGEGISLRVDNTSTRIEDNNSSFIPTALPINQLGGNFKLYCTHIPYYTDKDIDITPYVFEKADYDNLSSYDGSFPYCKAYALYYTQGQPNIRGLFFKNENDDSNYQWFKEYAIVNILAQALNVSPDDLRKTIAGYYADLKFRVEYNPIFKTRLRTNKPIVKSGLPRTIVYNQSANLIESRYLGENLKGVVARLGNVEKTYTYNIAFMSDIPKVGMRFDDNYIISSVSTKYLPTYIQVTISLTKNFNRISSYIGVNSYKRMWEVSEKQSQLRDSVFTDYLVFSKGYPKETNQDILANVNLRTLLNEDKFDKPISAVNVNRFTKRGVKLTRDITLPVLASAMGNSMSFTFGFEDNYSAGQNATHQISLDNNDIKVYSRYSDYISYGDYYGRFYYLGFQFLGGDISLVSATGNSLPSGKVGGKALTSEITQIENAIKYRKDNREIPQITYELQAVSKDEDLIIGSALTKNCSLVNLSPNTLHLVLLDTELNNINSNLREFWNFGTDQNPVKNNIVWNEPTTNILTISNSGDYLKLPSTDELYSGVLNHKSWAIITSPKTTYITVEDEDGAVTEQPIYNGCELVLGGNFSLNKTDKTIISMVKKKQVYD